MANVFVSYHRSDRARAEEAVASLVAHGFTVWWDDRVTPMETWDRTVEREIDDARCVLVLWTAESVSSDWVRIEANFAKMAKPAKLVQVRLEDCRVPINFSMIQYTDAFGESFNPADNEGWARALEWVGLFVGARPDRAPPPQPAAPKPKRRKKRQAQPVMAAVDRAEELSPPSPLPAAAGEHSPPPPPPRAPPPSAPPIDIEALMKRAYGAIVGAISGAFAFLNTGGYYRRGAATVALGAFAGALLYFWFHEMWVASGQYDAAWVIASPFVMRAAAATALAYVFVSTGRLTRQPALLFAAGFVAIHLIYRVLYFVFDVMFGSPSLGPGGSLLGDTLGFALLWLLARQFGAFKLARPWPLLWAATGANLLIAIAYAWAQAAERTPSDYDSGAWSTFMGTALLVESVLALVLIEPVRAAVLTGDKSR